MVPIMEVGYKFCNVEERKEREEEEEEEEEKRRRRRTRKMKANVRERVSELSEGLLL